MSILSRSLSRARSLACFNWRATHYGDFHWLATRPTFSVFRKVGKLKQRSASLMRLRCLPKGLVFARLLAEAWAMVVSPICQ